MNFFKSVIMAIFIFGQIRIAHANPQLGPDLPVTEGSMKQAQEIYKKLPADLQKALLHYLEISADSAKMGMDIAKNKAQANPLILKELTVKVNKGQANMEDLLLKIFGMGPDRYPMLRNIYSDYSNGAFWSKENAIIGENDIPDTIPPREDLGKYKHKNWKQYSDLKEELRSLNVSNRYRQYAEAVYVGMNPEDRELFRYNMVIINKEGQLGLHLALVETGVMTEKKYEQVALRNKKSRYDLEHLSIFFASRQPNVDPELKPIMASALKDVKHLVIDKPLGEVAKTSMSGKGCSTLYKMLGKK